MKKIVKILSIQFAVFILLLILLEIFCYFQIRNGHLFHFEARVDSSFYPTKNTREYFTNPAAVKYGIFPKAPQVNSSTNPLTPLQFSFTYTPQVAKTPGYGKIDGLPFFIQTKTEQFHQTDDVHGSVYDVEYGIDSKYRRSSTAPENIKKRDRFVILVGCSIAFGAGLNDDQTLTSVINKKSEQLVAYNYGMRGASPGDILLRLQSINKSEDIPQSTGTVIYIYIDDHIARMAHDFNIIGTWGAKSSYYNYGSDGQVTYVGTYEEVFPLKTWLYKLIFETHIAKYFFLGTFNNVTTQDFERTSKVIQQMQTVAFEKLHAEKFYVLFYPASYSSHFLTPFLERKNIEYLDYSNWNMFQLTRGHSIIEYDGHPTYDSNLVLGESLYQIIENGP